MFLLELYVLYIFLIDSLCQLTRLKFEEQLIPVKLSSRGSNMWTFRCFLLDLQALFIKSFSCSIGINHLLEKKLSN